MIATAKAKPPTGFIVKARHVIVSQQPGPTIERNNRKMEHFER
jgi:hypothetical protein